MTAINPRIFRAYDIRGKADIDLTTDGCMLIGKAFGTVLREKLGSSTHPSSLAATRHFAARYPVDTLDGARIDFGDGAWAGIRQSNTSPSLSVCIEARSPEKPKQVEEEVWSHLRAYPDLAEGE